MAEAKVQDVIVDRRYTYIHDQKWPSEAIDVHHIVVEKTRPNWFLSACLFTFFLIGTLFLLFLAKDNKDASTLFLGFLSVAVLAKQKLRKTVVKESVVVMSDFGVQLETHYSRGRIVRRFIPIGKILKPVVLECVTPVTCYWSLSLILHDETDLIPVFKELRPPVKLLVPIWKALCLASGTKEGPHKY